MQIFPFLRNLFIFLFLGNCNFLWLIGNRTSCRPIQSVIILVINKSDSRFAVVRFCLSLIWLQTELDSTQSYYHYLSRHSPFLSDGDKYIRDQKLFSYPCITWKNNTDHREHTILLSRERVNRVNKETKRMNSARSSSPPSPIHAFLTQQNFTNTSPVRSFSCVYEIA